MTTHLFFLIRFFYQVRKFLSTFLHQIFIIHLFTHSFFRSKKNSSYSVEYLFISNRKKNLELLRMENRRRRISFVAICFAIRMNYDWKYVDSRKLWKMKSITQSTVHTRHQIFFVKRKLLMIKKTSQFFFTSQGIYAIHAAIKFVIIDANFFFFLLVGL